MIRLAPLAAFIGLAAIGLDGTANAGTILVAPDVCAGLTAHAPADDVAYEPGVDTAGKPVVSADLDDTARLDLPSDHEYWIAIVVPLTDAVTIAPGSNLDRIGTSDIDVGTVTVRDGEAFFNGVPLASAQQHALAVECARRQADASPDPPVEGEGGPR